MKWLIKKNVCVQNEDKGNKIKANLRNKVEKVFQS